MTQIHSIFFFVIYTLFSPTYCKQILSVVLCFHQQRAADILNRNGLPGQPFLSPGSAYKPGMSCTLTGRVAELPEALVELDKLTPLSIKLSFFFKTVLRIFRKVLPESRKPQLEAVTAAVCGFVSTFSLWSVKCTLDRGQNPGCEQASNELCCSWLNPFFRWWISFFFSSLRMPWCGNATHGISSKPFVCLNYDGLMRKTPKKQQHIEDFSWRTHGWITIFRSNY